MIYVLFGGFLLYSLFFLTRLRRMARESKEALRATEAMCDASEELYDWLERNPWMSRANGEFQEKVRKLIRAKKKFADTHPGTDMEPSIVLLNELIDQNK